MADYVPRKGELITLAFDPQSGHEQRGRRPALVVSNDLFNRHTGLCIACPITQYPPRLPVPCRRFLQAKESPVSSWSSRSSRSTSGPERRGDSGKPPQKCFRKCCRSWMRASTERDPTTSSSLTQPELARLVEFTEASAYADMFRAAPRAFDLQVEESDECTALFAPTVDILLFNRVMGLGLRTPASHGVIESLIERYRASGVRNFGVQAEPGSRAFVAARSARRT